MEKGELKAKQVVVVTSKYSVHKDIKGIEEWHSYA
jgi:hypothetical protein